MGLPWIYCTPGGKHDAPPESSSGGTQTDARTLFARQLNLPGLAHQHHSSRITHHSSRITHHSSLVTHSLPQRPPHFELGPHVADHRVGELGRRVVYLQTPGQRREFDPHPAHDLRFTPTRVGTTLRPYRSWRRRSVHPHTRGDNAYFADGYILAFGSPPHAWGQLSAARPDDRRRRFTPTRVGTTRRGSRGRYPWPVHPHTRGDNTGLTGVLGRTYGSPPHTWGQQRALPLPPHSSRFTPTLVGTTRRSRRGGRHSPVHPHTRGDNSRIVSTRSPPDGSPPHAWGQHEPPAPAVLPERFTPTRVGTTRFRARPAASRAVHPHTRGDNLMSPQSPFPSFGSPPQAWGQ